MEEKQEELTMLVNGISSSRKPHFLEPITNILAPLPIAPVVQTPQDVPFKLLMKGGCPQENWKIWVHSLVSQHQNTWKKAGVYEAILGSTYKIKKQKKLFIALAERWCVQTNTFVFSWGEATFTLEDLMVLGGFSVLGKPVFEPLDGDDMIRDYNKINAYNKMGSYYAWMEFFMGKGGEVEHVAFLILWLSRYVFPIKSNIIVKNVFSIAVHLSHGVQIALAPAVLASIYTDLSLFKRVMVAFDKNNGCGVYKKDEVKMTVCSPMYFVQLWVWERFPKLRPKPCSIKFGEPRLARWANKGELKVQNVRELIDSSGGCFQWKPYDVSLKNWEFDKWYKADGMCVSIGSEMEKDVEQFVRVVRVSELVGLDCIEHYAPHRVAMQFGFDQDIPGCINRQNETPQMAWSYYNRPIESSFVYIPPKLAEASVSTRYFEWWYRQEQVGAEDLSKKGRKFLEVARVKEVNPSAKHNCGSSSYITTTENRVTIDIISSDEEDGLSISKFISLRKKQKVFEHKISGETLVQCVTLSASVSNDVETLMDPVEVAQSDLPLTGTPERDSVCVNVTQGLSGNLDRGDCDNSNNSDDVVTLMDHVKVVRSDLPLTGTPKRDTVRVSVSPGHSGYLDHGDCDNSNNSDLERNGLKSDSQKVCTLVEGQGECEIKLAGMIREMEKMEADIMKEIDSRLHYLEELTRDLRLKKQPGNVAGNSSQHEPAEGM